MSAGTARPARRHVVVLFVDLVGSTELAERLDPELLRQVLDRYYDACTAGILAHGGGVEKYIGDAIMAVFGVPVSHEDDALRAIRAAHAARSAVGDLGAELAPTHGIHLDVHCGVASGEAMVVGSPGSDLRVVGDTVNTASRLQSAAGSGEILVDGDVARLARSHVRVEAVPPLRLKGKREPVLAWRLLSLEEDVDQHHEDDAVSLIGHADELQQLAQVYQRVVRGRQCCLVTLLGAPGIGKSRLVREFLRTLPDEVTVLAGQCPSYGAGTTYRPVVELFQSLRGLWTDVATGLGEDSVRALRSVLAPGGGRSAESGVEEVAQAIQSLLEVLGQRSPTVVVLDNLHWAKPTLLKLIEDVTAWLADVPVLFVCVARPELFEIAPNWGGGMSCAFSLEVVSLREEQMSELVAELIATRATDAEVVAHDSGRMHETVVRDSDGNPLFAELMLDMLVEEGENAPLPPTVQALLAARLDRLGDAERDVLERAATIGQTFTIEELGVLQNHGDQPAVTIETPLRQLLRHRLIRRGQHPAAFQFAQALTRDTVYTMTRKELRTTWHLALADWFSGQAWTAEVQEDTAAIQLRRRGDVTHHLEMAARIQREIHPDDPQLPALTLRAARALISDGEQALHRKDLPAAVALLERGRELLPRGDSDHRRLAVYLCDAGLAQGDGDRAYAAVDAAAELLPDDRRNQLTCAVQRGLLAVRLGGGPPALASLRDLLAGDMRDDLSWCRFHQLEALVRLGEDSFGAAEAALRAGLERARSLGDQYEEDRLLGGLCELTQWSPTPVREGLNLCITLSARFAGDRALLVPVLATRARLLALAGNLPEAREALDTAERHARDLHLDLAAIAVTQARGLAESLGSRHDAAATLFKRAASSLRAAGQPTPARTLEIYAARELLRHGDVQAATRELEQLRADAPSQLRAALLVNVLDARIVSLRGNHQDAIVLTRAARRQLERTDDPCLRGDVLADVACVYHAAGRFADATNIMAKALQHYLDKGADLLAERARGWLGHEERDR